MTDLCGARAQAPGGAEDVRDLTLAQELLRGGRDAEAEDVYRRILAAAPQNALCLHHLGLIAHRRGDHVAAAGLVVRAIAAQPAYVEALSNLGAIYRALGRPGDAAAATRAAIAQKPDYAQAHSNLGAALEDQGRLDEALEAYRRALSLNPGFVEAAANTANLLRKLGRLEEARAICEEAIAARPDAADPYFSLGHCLKALQQPAGAAEAFRRAAALRPRFAEAYVNLGNALQAQGAHEEALKAYDEAIALRPDMADTHANQGAAFDALGRLPEAISAYAKAVALDSKLASIRLWLCHKRRAICDWSSLEAEEAALLRLIDAGEGGLNPFAALSLATTPQQQLRIARRAARDVGGAPLDYGARPPRASGKLRIGYLSSDFCRHATALLIARLIELHDRSRFEIIAYSHGQDDRSEMSRRLRQAFDRFVEIGALSDEEAARRIHADGVDILIDLKGFTSGARLGILARRPAPVQASFLGFPATTGAEFIDFVIADDVIAPAEAAGAFSETIIRLPHSYQPNDSTRQIAGLTPTRARCGLPPTGFVFCSFNNSYKLTPAMFDIWARLLAATPGSVLWLLESNGLVRDNLRKEAALRGVDPDRLVFAPKLSAPEHLARHRLADLFLDTLPYNAHTTASDALWAGLPVLTCLGETFAGRVAASLLHALGLPELVTTSLADYEARARELACGDPAALTSLRHRLLAARLTSPLFDSPRYARDFEAALMQMWNESGAGGESAPVAESCSPAAATLAPIARVPYDECPLCGGTDIPLALGADCTRHALYQTALPPAMNWRECGDCGHVFTEGWFDAAAADVVFGKTHPNQTVGHDMERQRPVSARIVARVARHAPGGDWLDVGFGNGSLLFTAEEWGFAPVGLDLRKDNVAALKALGYEAHRLSIEDFAQPRRFSVVSMADVLEHLPFPRRGLAAAHALLQPGGVLFVSMPNMETMVWRLLHANKVNPYWGEIEHYHNFSRRRLYALLREHGFEPAEYHVSERYRVCMEVIAIAR